MLVFRVVGKKLLCCLCSLLITFSLVVPQSFAQQDTPDFEAPLIEHDESDFSSTDSSQVFGAQVADNVGLKSVKLFYRFDSDDEYASMEMRPIANSSYYTAQIASEATTIEYYIQAEDNAGNVVLRGFAFAPLVRDLSAPVQAEIPEPREEPVVVAEKSKSNILYYVLGAIAVGALVGLAGGGGDDDSSPGTPPAGCGDGNCTVTFTLNTP